MDDQINDVQLSFTCHQDWDAMHPADGGRHCNKCSKTVYDLTNSKADEFIKILNENGGNMCGRFRADQLAPVLPAWKRWLSAALVVIGINIFGNAAPAQQLKQKQPSLKKDLAETVVYNGIVTMDNHAEFPGGYEKFTQFLSKNLRPVTGAKGKVLAKIAIDPKGRLHDIKISKSLNSSADNEVIRVLKLSPKWIPAKIGKKPVESFYNLPIVFA